MVTVDDIAGVMMSRFAATTGFAAAVPGGAWFDRGPDDPTDHPYLVFKLRTADTELFSGPAMLQKFELRAAAYCPIDPARPTPQAVQQAVNRALAGDEANAWFRAAALRNAGDHVLHARPVTPDGGFDPNLREARDVFVCGLVVELLCEGDRSVS